MYLKEWMELIHQSLTLFYKTCLHNLLKNHLMAQLTRLDVSTILVFNVLITHLFAFGHCLPHLNVSWHDHLVLGSFWSLQFIVTTPILLLAACLGTYFTQIFLHPVFFYFFWPIFFFLLILEDNLRTFHLITCTL